MSKGSHYLLTTLSAHPAFLDKFLKKWSGREDLNLGPLDPQLSLTPANYYNLGS